MVKEENSSVRMLYGDSFPLRSSRASSLRLSIPYYVRGILINTASPKHYTILVKATDLFSESIHRLRRTRWRLEAACLPNRVTHWRFKLLL